MSVKYKRGVMLVALAVGGVTLIVIGLRIVSTVRQKQIRTQVLRLIDQAGGYEAVYRDCVYLFEAVKSGEEDIMPERRKIPSLSKVGYGVMVSTPQDGLLIRSPLGGETGGGQLWVYETLSPEKAPQYLVHITNSMYFYPIRKVGIGP